MKSFVATALIVLAAVFCISHVDGSRGSSVNSVQKRQIPLPPVRNLEEPCSNTELQRRKDAFACENPLIGQQLLDMYTGCGRNDLALREEQKCGRNKTGGFCFELNYNTTLTQLASSVVSYCFNFNSCGSFCNDLLQQLRDSTGCCANYLLTDARQGLFGDPLSSCGLQLPNNCSSTLSFVQRPNEMICSQREFSYRTSRLSCNPDYMTPFINVMRNCSREEDAQSAINSCGVNRYERFCFEAQTNASQLIGDVRSECLSSLSPRVETCPLSCKIALDRFRTGADCCLNNLYNNTYTSTSNFRTTNHVLWSLCGISSPGFCRNTIDNSSAYSIMLQVSVVVTGLSAIIAMLV